MADASSGSPGLNAAGRENATDFTAGRAIMPVVRARPARGARPSVRDIAAAERQPERVGRVGGRERHEHEGVGDDGMPLLAGHDLDVGEPPRQELHDRPPARLRTMRFFFNSQVHSPSTTRSIASSVPDVTRFTTSVLDVFAIARALAASKPVRMPQSTSA